MSRLVVVLAALLLAAPFAFPDEGHKHTPLPGENLGAVNFDVSCSKDSRAAFERAVAKLHSFWYDHAYQDFAALAEKDPSCAMANWGVAMTQYHPLWYPANAEEIDRAVNALQRALRNTPKTRRERDYLSAISEYFTGTDSRDHAERAEAYAARMQQLATAYPKDLEAQVFYALALLGTASPQDKTYAVQKHAGEVLKPLFKRNPQHPGLAHYIIHTYDSAALADQGLDAARVYAKIAPSVPHALHMPSHIFTRLGLWQESAETNSASAKAAAGFVAQGNAAAIREQLHAMDYMMYAYLQQGDYQAAKKVLAAAADTAARPGADTTEDYARAAIPARWAIEQRHWQEATQLKPSGSITAGLAITHWARALGFAKTNKLDEARTELAVLDELRQRSKNAAGYPWHIVIEVQRLQAAGWIAQAQGKSDEAVELLRQAAVLEDKTDKHPTTPGPVLPAREQLADLLLELGNKEAAAKEYAASLAVSPKRLNATKALESMKQVASAQ